MIYTFLRHFCWSDCKNEWISYSFIPRFLIKNISSKANNYQSTRWLVKHFDQQHFLTIGAGVNGKCWKSKGVMVVGIILQARYQTYFINITFRCFVCFSYYSSNTDICEFLLMSRQNSYISGRISGISNHEAAPSLIV